MSRPVDLPHGCGHTKCQSCSKCASVKVLTRQTGVRRRDDLSSSNFTAAAVLKLVFTLVVCLCIELWLRLDRVVRCVQHREYGPDGEMMGEIMFPVRQSRVVCRDQRRTSSIYFDYNHM